MRICVIIFGIHIAHFLLIIKSGGKMKEDEFVLAYFILLFTIFLIFKFEVILLWIL